MRLPVPAMPASSLAPAQADELAGFVRKLGKMLSEEGMRVEMDDAPDTVGYKIRKAEKQKIPYMLIIGDKEKALRSLTVRIRGQEKQPKMTVSAFIKRVKKEITTKV